ncbi:MAG TPA: hypothetical protein VK152_03555 [Paludibacter sp.]|nr:hypothetical protein [Paludibacter sp.]
MKTKKEDAANFKKLTPLEMSKIEGGKYITVIKDGKEITVWVQD